MEHLSSRLPARGVNVAESSYKCSAGQNDNPDSVLYFSKGAESNLYRSDAPAVQRLRLGMALMDVSNSSKQRIQFPCLRSQTTRVEDQFEIPRRLSKNRPA